MSNIAKASIIVGLVVLVGVVLAMKTRQSGCPFVCSQPPVVQDAPSEASEQSDAIGERSPGVAEVAGPDMPVVGDAVGAEAVVATDVAVTDAPAVADVAPAALPRLVDLGASTCMPCKMMEPILESLRHEYAGRLQVDFYDIRQQKEALSMYKVRVIPTQIFYDGQGKELWRHEGFLAKADILAKWKELGIDIGAESTQPEP